MSTNKLLLILLSAAAASGADAQQLYKQVGPDGKVTFTDRQPSGNGKVSVMRSNVLRPLEPDAPPASKITVNPKSGDGPAFAPNGSRAELEEAVSAVMLLSEVARKFDPICSPTPQAAKEYSVAVNAWRMRNSNFLQLHTRILMQVIDPTRRAQMQGKIGGRVDEALAEVTRLNPAWRAKWCDKSILDMTSGSNDIANNAAVAVPLITYKFR